MVYNLIITLFTAVVYEKWIKMCEKSIKVFMHFTNIYDLYIILYYHK